MVRPRTACKPAMANSTASFRFPGCLCSHASSRAVSRSPASKQLCQAVSKWPNTASKQQCMLSGIATIKVVTAEERCALRRNLSNASEAQQKPPHVGMATPQGNVQPKHDCNLQVQHGPWHHSKAEQAEGARLHMKLTGSGFLLQIQAKQTGKGKRPSLC